MAGSPFKAGLQLLPEPGTQGISDSPTTTIHEWLSTSCPNTAMRPCARPMRASLGATTTLRKPT